MQDRALEHDEDGHWSLRQAERDLIRLVEAGHVLGDHSFDHMFHNNDQGRDGKFNVYKDVGEDLDYFGEMNFEKVQEVMEDEGVSSKDMRRVKDTFFRYIRMPYTDNWRIEEKVEKC